VTATTKTPRGTPNVFFPIEITVGIKTRLFVYVYMLAYRLLGAHAHGYTAEYSVRKKRLKNKQKTPMTERIGRPAVLRSIKRDECVSLPGTRNTYCYVKQRIRTCGSAGGRVSCVSCPCARYVSNNDGRTNCVSFLSPRPGTRKR